jgi:hypothetical protein
MSLKLHYMGQNDSVNCTPAVPLTGDPGTDQQVLAAGNYVGGIIVALTSTVSAYTGNSYAYAIQPTNQPAFGAVGNIVPCDRNSTNGKVPFATLLNNGGEFAGAIGPSGSKKAPVVRAMWQGMVDSQAYGGTITNFAIGKFLYCGGQTKTGKYVATADAETADISGGTTEVLGAVRVGICTHVPTAAEPWLGVASLL